MLKDHYAIFKLKDKLRTYMVWAQHIARKLASLKEVKLQKLH
jgi:hypothetical protein